MVLQDEGIRQLQAPVAGVLGLLTDVTTLSASCETSELRGPARAVKLQASQSDVTRPLTARVQCSARHSMSAQVLCWWFPIARAAQPESSARLWNPRLSAYSNRPATMLQATRQ